MFRNLLKTAIDLAPSQSWPTYDDKELDRTEFLTSSEVAQCLRRTFFSKQPGAQGFTGNGYTERGHAIEAWIVSKLAHLEPLGYKFKYLGSDQRSFYDPETGLSGTPDGLLWTPDGKVYLLEFKSIDPRTNKNNLPRRKHKKQVQQNMYLVRHCLGLQVDTAFIIYIDASNVLDIDDFIVNYDEAEVKDCGLRADMLWSAKDADDLEPEGLYTDDCETCPFTRECSATINMQNALSKAGSAAAPFSDSLPSEGEALLSDDEQEAVHNFLYARAECKEFEEQVELWKPEVAQMVEKRNSIVVYNGTTLTTRLSPGRVSVDQKAMAADGIDVKKYMKVGKPFVTLNVKEPK